jgi:hypothetical protein
MLGSGALVKECIESGDVSDREDGIKQHTLGHSAGVMLVYTNSTTDKELDETLGLNLEGLRIDGQENQSEVKVSCKPGQEFVISLLTTGGGYSYGTSYSYLINDYTGPPFVPKAKAEGIITNFHPS